MDGSLSFAFPQTVWKKAGEERTLTSNNNSAGAQGSVEEGAAKASALFASSNFCLPVHSFSAFAASASVLSLGLPPFRGLRLHITTVEHECGTFSTILKPQINIGEELQRI